MRIPLYRLLMTAGICAVVFIAGCVDTSVNPIPKSVDYQSQLKVVNFVSGAGAANLTMNGKSLGSAAFGAEVPGSSTGFLTVGSGSKSLSTTFGSAAAKTYKFALATDYKYRVFLVGTAAKNDVYTGAQRYIFQTKDSPGAKNLFLSDTGLVTLFNGSPDATLDSVSVDGAAAISLGGVGAGATSKQALKLRTGAHSLRIVCSGTTSVTVPVTAASKGRYTVAVYDTLASLKGSVFIDD